MSTLGHHRIVIVGTGFAGLGSAIRLKQRGEHDFVLLERAAELGGTWRDNSYPAAPGDVPSHLYSVLLRAHPDWTRLCSPQAEIEGYLKRVADELRHPAAHPASTTRCSSRPGVRRTSIGRSTPPPETSRPRS